ncbi:MAG: hypothetical protein LUP94_02820, partial [Candidatus Methanomethylicus sp.]|nr:hypothetical protein [Candidatus Methanomethylicus sp.]
MARRKLLRVDLAKQQYAVEDVPPELAMKYIGGKGLAAYYAYRELGPAVDPLSADNKLFIFDGVLTGIYPGFTRYVVASKSPATGTWCDSYAGGKFGQELAKTGYIGMIIEGQSTSPLCLKVDGDSIVFEDSSLLRKNHTYGMCEALKPFSAMVIGKAGRNRVNFACIMNDMAGPSRAGVIGRGGLGVVMGSKNLDAIALRGKLTDRQLIPPEKGQEVAKLYMKTIAYLKNFVIKGIDLGGNLPAVEMCAGAKVLPVRNFTEGSAEGWEKMAVPEIKKHTIKHSTCPLCPLACGVHIKVGDDEVDRIEYETVALDGFNCNYLDLGKVARLCRLCNELGMDTMSAGVVAAFAMECTERGIHDFDVKFGDVDRHVKLLDRIAEREGSADILADGVKKASEKIGAPSLALQVKGLEF